MNWMWSIFFGAGIAGVAYSKIGRRLGYGDSQSVWLITGVVFVLATLFFYTLAEYVLHLS